jgi:hypothetical protein
VTQKKRGKGTVGFVRARGVSSALAVLERTLALSATSGQIKRGPEADSQATFWFNRLQKNSTPRLPLPYSSHKIPKSSSRLFYVVLLHLVLPKHLLFRPPSPNNPIRRSNPFLHRPNPPLPVPNHQQPLPRVLQLSFESSLSSSSNLPSLNLLSPMAKERGEHPFLLLLRFLRSILEVLASCSRLRRSRRSTPPIRPRNPRIYHLLSLLVRSSHHTATTQLRCRIPNLFPRLKTRLRPPTSHTRPPLHSHSYSITPYHLVTSYSPALTRHNR